MNASLTMEGVLRCATILLEASHVPVTLATLLGLMQDHVWVSELINNNLSKNTVCILFYWGKLSQNSTPEICIMDHFSVKAKESLAFFFKLMSSEQVANLLPTSLLGCIICALIAMPQQLLWK